MSGGAEDASGAAEDAPLASSSSAAPDATEADDSTSESADSSPSAGRPAGPPAPQFKPSTFILTFLFVLGILMLFDSSTRTGVATAVGIALTPLIGFGYHHVLLTMFLAGLIEMALTALAYNWATDWVKTARTQSWSSAFRKVQMEALKSGKKDRIDALKPHQTEVTRLSGELSIAQLKGMAVTWFLVIAIYTWVGLFIGNPQTDPLVNVGGAMVNLRHSLGPIPDWIVLFSLYTFPLSYVLRRGLKHYSLRRYELAHIPVGGAAGPAA
ncbi:MAG: EMC3/TMCO1 family protein [Thermoplasmata archaeon]|nr:EMC3/TMCO1 family protein [Thermoplasmata archaeon]